MILSDEEIQQAVADFPYREMFHLPMYKAIAKAQAKKILDEIERRHMHTDTWANSRLIIGQRQWQQLRKELE